MRHTFWLRICGILITLLLLTQIVLYAMDINQSTNVSTAVPKTTTQPLETFKNDLNSNISINNTIIDNDDSSIIILMSDNRDMSSCDYLPLTLTINYLYAMKHKYRFIYYQYHLNEDSRFSGKHSLKNRRSCSNDRAAPWCKILSIYHALFNNNNIKMIIWIDSDAVFVNHELNIETYLKNAEYSIQCGYLTNCSLITSMNYPWSNQSTSGTMIVYRKNITKHLLKLWWNSPNKHCVSYYKSHDFEQHCLNNLIANVYKDYISILNDRTFVSSPNQFWNHVGSDRKEERYHIFKNILNNNLLVNNSDVIINTIITKNTLHIHENNIRDIYMDILDG